MNARGSTGAFTEQTLTPAVSAEDFLAHPFGRYWAGPCHLHWSYSEALGGSVVWGHPSEADVRRIVRLWDYGRLLSLPASGIDVITDCSALERIDADAFALVTSYAAEHRSEFARRYRRHALVHPAGLTGATMAGLFALSEMSHAWKMFAELRPAFDWLEQPYAERAWAEIARITLAVRALSPIVRELHRLIEARPRDVRLSSAAQTLGRSERALQRELRNAGTSFREELERARIEAARRWLLETDLKVEAVARQVGLGSLATFSRMFRRATGEAPASFRRRQRDAEP